jgi:serine/threonine protein kinase
MDVSYYIVERKLGEGNFGEVYCVRNIKTQNKKTMRKE